MATRGRIRAPTERTCERCGRQEVWDGDREAWAIDGDCVGEPYCIHEWDINGTFSPYH